MSVQEIEVAIAQLTPGERSELVATLMGRHHEDWDKQIEDDLASGRLDVLLSEVDAEIKGGLAKPVSKNSFV